MQLELTRRVSQDASAAPNDVHSLKQALNRLGYYHPDAETGITRIAERGMIEALQVFQRDHDLKPDGILLPGGETANSLNKALAAQEKDESIKLEWHCTNDDNSCDACVAFDGTVTTVPEADKPHCSGACRCWVTLAPNHSKDLKIYDPPIEPVYPELYILPAIGGAVKLYSLGKNLLKLYELKQWKLDVSRKQLQSKFKHAKVFGVKGNANKKTLEEFEKAMQEHINSPHTRSIKGTYHKQEVTHYIDPKTRLNIIRDKSGKFLSGWELSEEQVENILRNGKLGGSK